MGGGGVVSLFLDLFIVTWLSFWHFWESFGHHILMREAACMHTVSKTMLISKIRTPEYVFFIGKTNMKSAFSKI